MACRSSSLLRPIVKLFSKPITEKDLNIAFPSHKPKINIYKKLSKYLRSFSIPLISTVTSYSYRNFIADLAAGLSEGIMHVPMGMSYATLANLPPQYGLYNSLIYPLIYLIFGTGRQVSVGVSAIEALFCGEAVDNIIRDSALGSVGNRVTIAISLSLFVGFIHIAMRFIGLSFVSNLLADPVMSGFSTASALLIATSQLKHILAVDVPRMGFPKTWLFIFNNLSGINIAAITIGIGSIIILIVGRIIDRTYNLKYPTPVQLLVVVLFTYLTYYLDLSGHYSVPIITYIPSNLPSFSFPSFPSITGPGVSPFIITLRESVYLSVLYFIMHISIAKHVAQKRGYEIDSGQELVALGLCNIIGSFFVCFPNATSLSRTSVVNHIGAMTTLHNIPAICVVIMTITVLTRLVYYLPYSALASIVIVGVIRMVDFGEGVRLFGLRSPDALLWMTAFIATTLFGPMNGILASILISLLWLLYKTAKPHTAILGRLPQTNYYRDIKRFPMCREDKNIKIFRFDSSINFSNSDYFLYKITSLDLKDIEVVIVDGSSINDLDVTAIRMLHRLVLHMNDEGILLLFANWKGPMRDFLERASFYDLMPPERCFLSLHDAVLWTASRKYKTMGSEYECLGMTPVQCSITAGGKFNFEQRGSRTAPARFMSQDLDFCTDTKTITDFEFEFNSNVVKRMSESIISTDSEDVEIFEKWGIQGKIQNEDFHKNTKEKHKVTIESIDEDNEMLCPAVEWDSVSTYKPTIKMIKEVTKYGESRRWGVASTPTSDINEMCYKNA